MSSIDKKLQSILPRAAAELSAPFEPTDAQRRAKGAFWSHFSDPGAPQVPAEISLALASMYANDRAISTWWPDPSFRSWFTNKDEFRQRLEYMSGIVLDNFFEIVTNRRTPAGARVKAGEIILQLAGKMTSGKPDPEKYLDEHIAKMNRKELEAYIQRNLKVLPPEPVAAEGTPPHSPESLTSPPADSHSKTSEIN